MEWLFERFSQMGGAGAGAYRNSLAGAGVPPTDLFVREVIQNSVDATAMEGRPVRIRFRELDLSGRLADDLSSLLQLQQEDSPAMRQGLLGDHSWSPMLEDHPTALVVEDFGTVGLGGTLEPSLPSTREDNFRRLVLEVGVTSEAEGRGGTFGYGKGVYWASSRLWTVIFYSRFTPSVRTGGQSSRLIGVSWFKEHNWATGTGAEVRFTGRAWLGRVEGGDCFPHVDAEADRIAGALGLTPRSAEATGTSALILGHQLDVSELSRAVERHWWPRYLDGLLEVELPDGSTPSPRANDEIRPFVRAHALARREDEPSAEEYAGDVVYKRKKLGSLGVVLSDRPSDNSGVALIRRPGMVVDYYTGLQLKDPPYAGVLIASDVMDPVLATSEPPAHDRWDHNTIRQDRPLSDDQRKDIETLLQKVRSMTRDFVTAHREPPAEPPPTCEVMERLFGEIFAPPKSGPPRPPARGPDIFTFNFDGPVLREVDANRREVRLRQDLTLEVAEEAFDEEDEILVRLDAWFELFVDSGRVAPRADRVKMEYFRCDDPTTGKAFIGEAGQHSSQLVVAIGRGDGAYPIELQSSPLPNPEYAGRLVIVAQRDS